MRYAEGLLVAHACLALAFVIGASVFPPEKNAGASACQNMVRLVCICALGFALIGFVGLLLAFVGLFNVAALFGALAALFAAAAALHRESPFARTYWRRRAAAIGDAWNLPLLAAYYAMLVIAFGCINLNYLGTDPLAYHLAYAADWAHTGKLTIDPFLVPPFYASNFSLLFGILLLVHADQFVIFLVWVTAALTALSVFAGITWLLEDIDVAATWRTACAACVTAALVLAPSYLFWAVSAYVDVPIGAFTLFSVLCLVLAVRERRPSWIFAAALLSGYLIGMKVSFLPLVAVFAIALWLAARSAGMRRIAMAGALALLVASSSPWYARNLVDAGDPMPPIINWLVYKHDGLMTAFEIENLSKNLHAVPKTPRAMIGLPFNAFWQATADEFNSDGTTALVLGLYLLVLAPLAWGGLLRRWKGAEAIAFFVLAALAGYWAFSSTSLRYALLFIPLLALCIPLLLGTVLGASRWRGPLLAALAALTLIPSPTTIAYLQRIYFVRYHDEPVNYVNDAMELEGYPEAQFTVAYLRRAHDPGVVYVADVARGANLHYYFRRQGYMNAGDWVGPGSWFRLYEAIGAHQAAPFMKGLDVAAILIGPSRFLLNSMALPLERQLDGNGYCSVNMPSQDGFKLYVRCGDV